MISHVAASSTRLGYIVEETDILLPADDFDDALSIPPPDLTEVVEMIQQYEVEEPKTDGRLTEVRAIQRVHAHSGLMTRRNRRSRSKYLATRMVLPQLLRLNASLPPSWISPSTLHPRQRGCLIPQEHQLEIFPPPSRSSLRLLLQTLQSLTLFQETHHTLPPLSLTPPMCRGFPFSLFLCRKCMVLMSLS